MKMSKSKKKKWIMPEWMEKYRKLIGDTGGNTIEELMNYDSFAKGLDPLGVLACCVSSQITLLKQLYALGVIK